MTMDPIRTITPPGATQQVFSARPSSAPVAQAVATELPAAIAVTAANSAGPTVNNAPGSPDPYEYEVLVDPATHEAIYRTVDERSRQVVRQAPDQALLRMRAYARTLAEGATAAHGEAPAAPDPHPPLRQNSAPATRNPKL
jgi:hypothetical protein